MKVLHISNSDIEGGASRAAYRIHRGLLSTGVMSQMFVFQKQTQDPAVQSVSNRIAKAFPRLLSYLDVLPTRLYRKRQHSPGWAPPWGTGWLKVGDAEAARHRTDIAHVHWIGSEFFSVGAIQKLGRPVVWTLHDMWAFTGGCHYAQKCTRYEEDCGRCPILGSDRDLDLSHWVWKRKFAGWRDADITIVAPSRWIGELARRSSLFRDRRIEVIPYGLDLATYRPIDKALARSLLGLPQDRRLVLFGTGTGATDPRKGYAYLQQAMQKLSLSTIPESTDIVVIGPAASDEAIQGWRSHFLGVLHDDISLALIYSAVDVLAAPYVEDNLPNMILESLACATPCVAFEIGGMPDMIEHLHNGYLARPFDPNDLANGIRWILEDEQRRLTAGHSGRDKVEKEYGLAHIATKHKVLYESLLAK